MWVGGISFIYTLHLGEVVKCFFFEKIGKGLFCVLSDLLPRISVSFWPALLNHAYLAGLCCSILLDLGPRLKYMYHYSLG